MNIKQPVPKYEHVKIQILNSNGQLLKTLVDSLIQIGNYRYEFNKLKYGNGIYYIKYIIGKNTIVKQVVSIK